MNPSPPEPERESVTGERPDLLAGQHFPSQPQQERSRRKRDALLQSALLLFAERGYEDTSIEEIAHRADVAVGGFYQHFASKRQIVLVLMDRLLEEASALTAQTDQVNLQDIQSIIAHFVRQGLQVDWSYAGAYRAWREAALKDRELRELNIRVERWLAGQLEMLLSGLLLFPGARADVDVATLAWELCLLFLRLAETPIESSGEIDAVVESLTRLIYHGLFKDEDDV
jgi:TetR/AcrR family transcriptional regulator, mexJK operon transcriptional repressor